jgi:hypothetical protein
MCFSPEASFAGGIIITAIGVATVRKVHNPTQIVFASIPLFFGIQQIAEGFVWITLPGNDYINLQKISTYLFLIMAQVIWPLMIPVSIMLMEENIKRKRILRILSGIGLSLSIYYSYCLMTYFVYPEISGHHILYKNGFPHSLSNPAFGVYLIVTITPLFISGIKRTWLLGTLMTLSCLVTTIFFRQYLTSVWCFFAALISGVVFWILADSHRTFTLNRIKLLKPESPINIRIPGRIFFIIIPFLSLYNQSSGKAGGAFKDDEINRLWLECKLDKILPVKVFNFAISGYQQTEKIRRKNILTIIDFSKPSTEKRCFVVDIDKRKLLYHCLVAHGKNSGDNYAGSFSNEHESLKSSLGFYLTAETYSGKHGYSLRLDGLEKSFNDNARAREIVIHGADYVSQEFIDKHGRLGRSWGCPALPVEISKEMIDNISYGSCLFIYGKDESYFVNSTFINIKTN